MKSLMIPFLILLILAGCASKPSPNLCASVCNGLVAYYPFYGDATDKSGNGHDGKVIGSTLTKTGTVIGTMRITLTARMITLRLVGWTKV